MADPSDDIHSDKSKEKDGGSGDPQQRESASSEKATGGTDFAPQGRGAAEEEDDGEGHPS